MEQAKYKVVYVINERGDRSFWNRVGVRGGASAAAPVPSVASASAANSSTGLALGLLPTPPGVGLAATDEAAASSAPLVGAGISADGGADSAAGILPDGRVILNTASE